MIKSDQEQKLHSLISELVELSEATDREYPGLYAAARASALMMFHLETLYSELPKGHRLIEHVPQRFETLIDEIKQNAVMQKLENG